MQTSLMPLLLLGALPQATREHESCGHPVSDNALCHEECTVFGLRGVDLSTYAPRSRPHRDVLTCSSPPGEAAGPTVPWPGGIVPFQFDDNVSFGQRQDMLAAMAVISSVAEVGFVDRNGEPAFLHIEDAPGNSSSSIGWTGGQVTVRLFNWNVQGIVIHELMHALGYIHEHQRLDRDAHVAIGWNNIQTGFAGNFTLLGGGVTYGPYDFDSLMHYARCAFSICCPPGASCNCAEGCETIVAPQEYEDVIGQRQALSILDAHGLRSLYQKPEWRFVDAEAGDSGSGAGVEPWDELVYAVELAQPGSTVFVMPGDYPVHLAWSTEMTVVAPLEQVVVE